MGQLAWFGGRTCSADARSCSPGAESRKATWRFGGAGEWWGQSGSMYLKLVFNSLQLIGGRRKWTTPAWLRAFRPMRLSWSVGIATTMAGPMGTGARMTGRSGHNEELKVWRISSEAGHGTGSPCGSCHPQVQSKSASLEVEWIRKASLAWNKRCKMAFSSFMWFSGNAFWGCPRFLWKCRSRSLSLPPLFLSRFLRCPAHSIFHWAAKRTWILPAGLEGHQLQAGEELWLNRNGNGSKNHRNLTSLDFLVVTPTAQNSDWKAS